MNTTLHYSFCALSPFSGSTSGRAFSLTIAQNGCPCGAESCFTTFSNEEEEGGRKREEGEGGRMEEGGWMKEGGREREGRVIGAHHTTPHHVPRTYHMYLRVSGHLKAMPFVEGHILLAGVL